MTEEEREATTYVSHEEAGLRCALAGNPRDDLCETGELCIWRTYGGRVGHHHWHGRDPAKRCCVCGRFREGLLRAMYDAVNSEESNGLAQAQQAPGGSESE